MSDVSRTLIATALGYLLLSMAAGVALALPDLPAAWKPALRPVHLHLLVVGWLTQLVFGVALWLFPRRRQLRRQPELAWSGYALLNVGLLLRAGAEPALSLSAEGPWAAATVASAACQWAAFMLFVACLWPRVRGR